MKANTGWLAVVMIAWSVGAAPAARAHCDTLNGPVVADARVALESGKPEIVLKWVESDQEPEIRAAFAQTLAVRKLSPQAAALADRWFFETLVRIHRAAEGAPYTGLKEATDLEPGVELADRVLASGDAGPLLQQASEGVEAGLLSRFRRVRDAQAHMNHGVEAGRAYVAAYVDFVHFAERVFAVTEAAAAASNSPSSAAAPQHVH
jgi:hypothetical protein